jgi:hypothetical protein
MVLERHSRADGCCKTEMAPKEQPSEDMADKS